LVSREEVMGVHQCCKKSGDVCCIPGNVKKAADLLSLDERDEVKRSGFGAFLDLKLIRLRKPKAVVNLMSVSELKEDHIANVEGGCSKGAANGGEVEVQLKRLFVDKMEKMMC
jgi:hypothetical protein